MKNQKDNYKKMIGRTLTPQEHHNCKGKYPSWETTYKSDRTVNWCYGCGRTFYANTGEETHLFDRNQNL